jgi:hypothetical protein
MPESVTYVIEMSHHLRPEKHKAIWVLQPERTGLEPATPDVERHGAQVGSGGPQPPHRMGGFDRIQVRSQSRHSTRSTGDRNLARRTGTSSCDVFMYKGYPVQNANNTAWRSALTRAGITDFRWHDLRHTFASYHALNGTPLLTLKALGGWQVVTHGQQVCTSRH